MRTVAVTGNEVGMEQDYNGSTVGSVTLSDDHIGNDDVVDSYTSATFDTKDVGTNKVRSEERHVGKDANAGNYTLGNTTASTTANITPRTLALTVSAAGIDKAYDGST